MHRNNDLNRNKMKVNLTLKPTYISRRLLLKLGSKILGTGTFMVWFGWGALIRTFEASALASELPQSPRSIASAPEDNQSRLTSAQVLQKLMTGNDRFVASKRQNPHQDFVRVIEVAQGQAPFAAILSCADSRVVPEIVFDQGIGDLFVVRVAGNIATIEDIASEEYAAAILQVPLLMVLGHERCGAVSAALQGGEFPGTIGSLVAALQPAIDLSARKPGDQLTNAIKANVMLQVKRLQGSPVITQLVQRGQLQVVGGYYDLDTGKVELL
jgi:carbonic anhydrase